MIEKSRLPVVTLLLIVANLFAAFGVAYNPDLALDFGFNPKDPTFLDLFTSLFIHQNLLHLLGNMIFLAAVGAAVELATGSLRFILVYLVSGLFGCLAHWLVTSANSNPSLLIGASGAIAGCAAYYSVRYTHLKVPVAPQRGLSVAAITAIWLVLQIVGAFVHIGESSGVSFWAHIGGFVAGLILSVVFRAPDLGQRRLGHAVLDTMNERGPAAVALAARRHLEDHPRDRLALRRLAEAEKQLGHSTAEVDCLKSLLEVDEASELTMSILRLSELKSLSEIPTVKRVQLAVKVGKESPDAARCLLESVIQGEDEAAIPDAMLSLAALELNQNPEAASGVLAELQAKYPLHPTVEVARKRGWIT